MCSILRNLLQQGFSIVSVVQPLGVPGNMLSHEGRDEVIGMVIAWLHPDSCRDTGFGTGCGQ
jgi:hypothetical protein